MRIMVTIAASIWVLSSARGVLEPIAIAGLIWFLLSATARFYRTRGTPVAKYLEVTGV